MAEGVLRHYGGDKFEVESAGSEPSKVNETAIKVMKEIGIDISKHYSKSITDLKKISFDWVITVCDYANKHCPVFPYKTKVFHKSFEDPPKLARNSKTKEETITHYRKVRDEIKSFIETLPELLAKK